MYISNNMYSLYQVHDLHKVVHQFSMFTPSSLPWMSGLWSRNASNKGAAIWAICNLQSDEPSTFLDASDIQSPQFFFMFFPIQIPNHLDFSFKVNKSIWGSMITGQELGTKCVAMDSNPILYIGSHNMIDAMLYQSTGSQHASFKPPGQEPFKCKANKRTRKKTVYDIRDWLWKWNTMNITRASLTFVKMICTGFDVKCSTIQTV